MPGADWTVREYTRDDLDWLQASLASDLSTNGYFHGVDRDYLSMLAERVFDQGWKCLVVEPAQGQDEGDFPAGWVLYHSVPTLSIAMAYVDPSYRGLGAWRALRERVGLQEGQLVNVVLASPKAMAAARQKYQAKQHWGRVLEWLL
jgi:GNAT superfamily N-acetyltransferase